VHPELNVAIPSRPVMSRIAHTIERLGLAMAGATCGFYVAANLVRDNDGILDPTGFVVVMSLIGMLGFYLGINMPPYHGRALGSDGMKAGLNPVEWFSAFGTFLTAMAALVSVAAIVLDETPQSGLMFLVGAGWLLGVGMQIGAGAIARLRTTGEPF
jgi:hypothetical protein